MHPRASHAPLLAARLLVAVLILIAIAGPARSQEQEVDRSDASYVKSLMDLGLNELIAALAQNPPTNPDEAAALRNALIDQWLPGFQDSPADFQQAIDTILAYHKKMMDAPGHADHWARPLWATDTAQRLLLNALASYRYAGDFALLGFPDAAQRSIVDQVAGQCLGLLIGAEDEHFRLMRTLRAQVDFTFEIVNTGRLEQMQRYQTFNIPYYRAWAIALLLTSPDNGAYFSKNGGADKRKSLLDTATRDVQALLERAKQMPDLLDDTQAQLHLLGGLLALHRNQADQATALFNQAMGFAEASDYSKTLIALGQAAAQQASQNTAAAATTLQTLSKTKFIKESPLHRVIIADRAFLPAYRAAMSESDPHKKKQLIDQAFDIYVQLFASGDLGEWESAVRPFVEDRYKDQVPDGVALVDLPPVVRFAKVRAHFDRGEQLRESDAAAANEQYALASAAAADLIKTAGDGLSKTLHAEVLFFKGFAELRMNQAGVAVITFLDLAEGFADLQRGEQAANVAYVSLARPLYEKFKDNEEVRKIYERSLRVLIEKYPTTDAAKLATYDYAAFLREQGRYADAVEAYSLVPEDHPAYLAGQYEKLACLAAQWSTAPGEERGGLATRLSSAVQAYIDLAESRLPRMRGEELARLRSNIASARLIGAQLLNEAANRPDDAMRELEQISKNFSDVQELAPRILSLTIRVRQKQGQFAQAEQLLIEYMKTDPVRAGQLATVVLQSLNGEMKELVARKGDQAKIEQLAQVAVNLADKLVLPWAREHKEFTKDELLSFEIMPADSLLASGKFDQSLARYQQIVKDYGTPASKNIDVVLGLAESNFHLGQTLEASKGYKQIIENSNIGGAPKNATYWQAQMRFYQLLDKVAGEKKNTSIYLNIRNLFDTNPALGGDPYKTELLRLRDKHAPQ